MTQSRYRHDPVWLPHGTRMDAAFAITDVKIGALAGFVEAVAGGLRDGRSLSAAVRSAARRHPAAADAFSSGALDRPIESSFALRDTLTFPDEPLPATIGIRRQNVGVSLNLDSLLAHDVRSFLEMCGSGRQTADAIRGCLDEPCATLFESLLESALLAAGPPPPRLTVPVVRSPGVLRLQHAGLLFRGRDTGILVDPHFHSSFEPDDLRDTVLRCQCEGLVDAILISHGHRDHWHLPTLMTFPSDTLIVVPKVPRATMLSPDFAATLRALGFTRVVPLGWSDPPVQVGDLEVHALPFYGEQPLVSEAPRHPELRNHGNTYVVRHESYTSWFLIDSGNDWMGRMADVAPAVKARFGAIDMLLSNLHEFPIGSPLYITGGHYWLALTTDQWRRFGSLADETITLGPAGVAEICHLAGARIFLPYAHWWGDVGTRPGTERSLTEELRASLAALGAATDVVPWCIGDSYVPALRP